MTDRLKLYNGALLSLGERLLSSLTEDREPLRKLNAAWDLGLVDYCLKLGFWKFALRTIRLEEDVASTPSFGHQYPFLLPDDYLRTYQCSRDEYNLDPLFEYQIEGRRVYASINQVYLRYVSNHADFGGDMTLWPPDFTDVVVERLAYQISHTLKNKTAVEDQKKKYTDAVSQALTSDAIENPPMRKPEGSWNRSRRSYGSSRRG